MYLSASRFLDPLLSRVRPKLASSIQGQLNPDGRLFLAPGLSPTDFYGQLRDQKIASVRLPAFSKAAAIELLIADEDLDRIGDLTTKWPGPHPIKLYSVTGGRRDHRFEPPGLGRKSQYAVSLFPPNVAEALIGRAQPEVSGTGILGPADALMACAYRAAYLQPECWEQNVSGWIASASCEAELSRLAAEAGVDLDGPITPHKLADFLAERGWAPSFDLLERAAHWMPSLRDILPDQEDEEAPGVTLFFLRARAVEAGHQASILESLRDNGFEPLSVVELHLDQRQKAAAEFRGGNWGRGPYRISGGPPATICVALDLLPLIVDERDRAEFGDFDNRRIVQAKSAARDLVNAGIAEPDHYNPVHSTDNTAQTWRAVRALIPGQEPELRRRAERLRRDFATGGAISDLTKHGRRAKVELIDFEDTRAIRKTFRPSALQFMEREIEVMERLAPLCAEVPRLLARGTNFIVMDYVGNGAVPLRKRRPNNPPRPLPLRHVRKLAELIRMSVANGFDPIDLRADGNVIYTPTGLHLIDFEFWRPCEPGRPEASMCLSGIPRGDTGEQPRARIRNRDPYRLGWYPYTLLSVESFLYDPPALQRIKRSANFALAYATWASRGFNSFARGSLKRGSRTIVAVVLALIGPRTARLLAPR